MEAIVTKPRVYRQSVPVKYVIDVSGIEAQTVWPEYTQLEMLASCEAACSPSLADWNVLKNASSNTRATVERDPPTCMPDNVLTVCPIISLSLVGRLSKLKTLDVIGTFGILVK